MFVYALFAAFALVGIVSLFFAFVMIKQLFTEAKLGGIFRTGVEGEPMTFALTDAYFSHYKHLRKVWLQTPNGGTPAYAEQILLSSAGIFVISSFSEKGRIQNPIDRDWTQINGKMAKPIANPFLKNLDALCTIEDLAMQNGLACPVIYSIVVCTEQQVFFSENYDLLVPADEFPSCIKRLSKNRFYSKRKLHKYVQLLEKNRARKTT